MWRTVRPATRARWPKRRRGAVLLLVLVVVPVLALGCYGFTHWMRAEARASSVTVQQIQACWLAESGIELVRALLADPETLVPGTLNLDDNPSELGAQIIFEGINGRAGMVSLVVSNTEGTDSQIQFGLVSESAKIPLHVSELELTRNSLMGLPNMTEQIADSILDWIDDDDEERELGVEMLYYGFLDPPYEPRNGPPKTLDELLLVDGVTAELLYGEDYNLNGILDPNEDDGDENWPPDNADGALDRGWYPYLTIHSAAVHIDPLGEPKLNINGDDQEAVTALLAEIFDEEMVAFYEAYRAKNGNLKAITELIDAQVTIQAEQQQEAEQNRQSSTLGTNGQPDFDATPDPVRGSLRQSTSERPTANLVRSRRAAGGRQPGRQ